MKFQNSRLFVVSLVVAAVTGAVHAQTVFPYNGGAYLQDFNSLANTGSGNAWNNNLPPVTLTGWSVYRANSAGIGGLRDSTGTGMTAYGANDGASATGSIYSYGAAGSPERALGDLGSGTTGDVLFILAMTNTSGRTLTQATIDWKLEQWRQGGQTSSSPAIGTQHSLIFDYKINSGGGIGLSDTLANFTTGFISPGGAFNGTGPVGTLATAAAVDGNTTGKQGGRGGILTGLNWTPGATLVMRWWDDNNTGNDHGLAIDECYVQAVPEPSTWAAMGLGAVVLLRRKTRKG